MQGYITGQALWRYACRRAKSEGCHKAPQKVRVRILLIIT